VYRSNSPKKFHKFSGALSEYDSVSDSGNKVIRKFCGACGSPILIEFEREDYRDSICIKAGSLDDASWLQPQCHCFTATKQPWIHINDDLPQFTSDTQSS